MNWQCSPTAVCQKKSLNTKERLNTEDKKLFRVNFKQETMQNGFEMDLPAPEPYLAHSYFFAEIGNRGKAIQSPFVFSAGCMTKKY